MIACCDQIMAWCCRLLLLLLLFDLFIGSDLRLVSYKLVWLDKGPAIYVAPMVLRAYVTDRVRVAGYKVRLLLYYVHGHLG